MNHKVLLADDSLTIQKVIKITLANQPYDITEASSEEELFHQLPTIQPKLVFLDFNLSEKYTGYELTTKIKSICPNAKVLLLLGTFDTVDDASMEKCGASDKIVKPFDSNKFIAICKQLIDTFADDEIAYPESKAAPVKPVAPEEDQWTVSHSTEQKVAPTETRADSTLPNRMNPLLQEVSDWGMSVPGIINDTSAHDKLIDIPPVIGAEVAPFKELKSKKEEPSLPVVPPAPTKDAPKNEPKFPATEDLDYPTIEEVSAAPQVPPKPEEAKTTSKLISLESLSQPMELELENNYVVDETDIQSLEAQIRDEVEEDLWKVDEFEDLKKEVATKIEEAKATYEPASQDFDESLFKPIDDSESITWKDTEGLLTGARPTFSPETAVDLEEIRREMEEMVKKYVKEYMDQMFQQNTEKVAWEVIPDLAENLIRQELSKISGKILNDQA